VTVAWVVDLRLLVGVVELRHRRVHHRLVEVELLLLVLLVGIDGRSVVDRNWSQKTKQ
jgi:uncharacterized membrane protein YbjE (DUF340 family)